MVIIKFNYEDLGDLESNIIGIYSNRELIPNEVLEAINTGRTNYSIEEVNEMPLDSEIIETILEQSKPQKYVKVQIYYRSRAYVLSNFSQEGKDKIRSMMEKVGCTNINDIDWNYNGWTCFNTIIDPDEDLQKELKISQFVGEPLYSVACFINENSNYGGKPFDEKLSSGTDTMLKSEWDKHNYCNAELIEVYEK